MLRDLTGMLSLKVGTFGRTNLTAMRHFRIVLILLPFLGSTLFSVAQPNPAEIEEMLQDFIADEGVPAIVACTVNEYEITWMGAFGMANIETNLPATVDTPFMLASTSKTVTSGALLHAIGYNVLGIGLDDPINDYLPFEVNHPDFETAITFRMLLTHTAAIDDNWDVMPYCDGDCETPLEAFVEDYFTPDGDIYSATSNFHSYEPGTQYNYSNMGFALAGYCVEAITNLPFDYYCETVLFSVLCMNNTHWFLDQYPDESQVAMPYYTWDESEPVPVGHYGYNDYPDGQLRSSVKDIGYWLMMWLRDGIWWDVGIFPGNMVFESFQVQFGDDQGLTWYQQSMDGATVWTHNGGDQGVTSDFVIDRESGTGFAIISNGESYHDELLDEMQAFASTYQPSDGVNDCFSVGTSELAGSEWGIFPNPSGGSTTLSGLLPGERVEVYASDGRLVDQFSTQLNTLEVDRFPPGIYFLRSSQFQRQPLRWVVY